METASSDCDQLNGFHWRSVLHLCDCIDFMTDSFHGCASEDGYLEAIPYLNVVTVLKTITCRYPTVIFALKNSVCIYIYCHLILIKIGMYR
jgi:hypothetical protein